MMSDGLAVTLAIVLLGVLLTLRAPIFVALGASGMLGLYLINGLTGLEQIPISLVDQLQNFSLIAAPMYILMGEILSVSGLGRDLFRAAHHVLGRMPGSLGASAIGASTVFGAMSGVSISSVAVVGRMSVPEMLNRGYKPSFASGSVTASGALAMLIPPSLMFILYSSVTGVSISKLFAGGVVPGLILSTMMITYVVVSAKIRPSLAPAPTERFTWGMRLRAVARVAPALVLILLVLGSMYTGLATPTEAAAVGALGALFVVGVFYRGLSWARLRHIVMATTQVSGAVLAIVGSAYIFTQMLVVVRVPELVTSFVAGLAMPPYLVMVGVMLIMVFLGCLVDAASLLLVVTPILVPAMSGLGFDPLWLGVLIVVNLEMAVITPPVGLNLYTMKSVVPDLDLGEIFRGIMPYLLIEATLLAVMIAVPGIATWLPSHAA
jgi:tripartite ATP-independent transporter DctM subunit